MIQVWRTTLIIGIALIWTCLELTTCNHSNKGHLTVIGGREVTYQRTDGESITVAYYTLSDNSLNFVKLHFSDGRELTLPQVVSASGARYTDERDWEWWIKGESAMLRTRDGYGQWQTHGLEWRATSDIK